MRYTAKQLSVARTATVLAFVVGMLTILLVLYVKFGGGIPGVTNTGYKVDAAFPDVQNLVRDSDVEMAGVPIGKVLGLATQGGHDEVTMVLHHNAPLHQGAAVQIRAKTMLNETYVQITDGSGPALPSGARLPLAAVQNETTINDVLNTLDPTVRAKTAALIEELQAATAGQGGNIDQTLAALGDVGRNGDTVFDVLANQSADVQQLVKQTATLLGVLDEGQGQIAQLVTSAQQVNQTTANARASVAGTISSLPGLMQAIKGAAGSVQTLSTTLQPIAANLQQAAPTLDADLVELPGVTTQLRQINPPLQAVLQVAPATLTPVQTTATAIDQLNPSLAYTLSELNPMVAYLAPYRADLGSFASNFGATAAHQCGAGCPNYTVAEPILNANSYENTDPSTGQTNLVSGPSSGGLGVNADPGPGQINGSTTSPQPPPPSYTPVLREKY
ncbi:MAG TPA: MlaD family protein [Acidimicrobiales bacterium]|nr:MlaD family protein [Acidimicrobiales bacterium]